MPAKGNVYVLPEGDPMAGVTAASLVGGVHEFHQQAASVDHLVQEIKENLKLGSAVTAASLKAARASSHLHHRHRSSPYAVAAVLQDRGGSIVIAPPRAGEPRVQDPGPQWSGRASSESGTTRDAGTPAPARLTKMSSRTRSRCSRSSSRTGAWLRRL